MKNEDYIIVHGWMINELSLSGNELLCYALLFGLNSQDSNELFVDKKAIAEVLGVSSMNTIKTILKKLMHQKLVQKHEKSINGLVFSCYSINYDTLSNFDTPYQKLTPPVKFCIPPSKIDTPPSNFDTPRQILTPIKIKEEYIDNLDNTDIKNKEKIEDKSSTKKKEKKFCGFVEKIYSMYPSKCPVRNTTLGKSYKDKERIQSLMSRYSEEDIEAVVKAELDEKYGKHYMQNFSTFLNNFPDPQTISQPSLFEVESESQELNRDSMVINGVLYR